MKHKCSDCFVTDVVWSPCRLKNIEFSKIEDIVASVLKHAKQRRTRQILEFSSLLMTMESDRSENQKFELLYTICAN